MLEVIERAGRQAPFAQVVLDLNRQLQSIGQRLYRLDARL